MMKKTFAIFLVLAGFVLIAVNPVPAAVKLATGAHYDSFSSDQGGEKGSQFLMPVSLSLGTKNGWFGGLASGYVSSSYTPPAEGADAETLSTFLDTKLSLFYSTSLAGACVRVGSTFSLPTGRSDLTLKERRTEMDQFDDLVGVTDFGGGTSANPGFTFAVPLGRLILGGGLSHHFRGEYDPTAEIENDEVDPGDESLAKVSVAWDGGRHNFLVGVRYLAIWPDKVGGREVYKEGDMVSTNFRFEFKPRPWRLTLEGSYNTWFKGKRLVGEDILAVDEIKRLGDDFAVRAVAEYQVWPTLVVLALGRGRWVQANDYPSESAFYDGGRTAFEGLAGFRYTLLPGVFLNGSVAYTRMDANADALTAADTSYQGFRTALNIETSY
jgi:hypothetical protein